ncbi:MAG: hypothetical protein WC430_03770 [Patescibacteria group bacterium]
MPYKILQAIAKPFTTKIPNPWDKVCLVVILSTPVYALLVILPLFVYSFISKHYLYGLTIDLMSFSIVPFVTLVFLTLHHILSKTRSTPRLIHWGVTLICLEVIAYIWFRAWGIEHLFTTEGGTGYVLTTADRLEIILSYTKALFQTMALGLVLIIIRKSQ